MLTFDDITDQLSDQRRAAWSTLPGVSRTKSGTRSRRPACRGAAAATLREGNQVRRRNVRAFTGTIVRQVGDLRRMVDEFRISPRPPAFRDEDVHEIARQALFLHKLRIPRSVSL